MMEIVAAGQYRNPQHAESVKRALVQWAAQRLNCTFTPWANAIGIRRRGGALVAVVVFDGVNGWNCEVSVASDGSGTWLSRRFLRVVGDYAFVQLGLERVTVMIDIDNMRPQAVCPRLGFIAEGRMRRSPPAGDVIVMGLLRSDYPWTYREGRRNAA